MLVARRPHEGVIIDDIAEERAARAKALKEDFPGSRNIPSTGLNVPEPEASHEKTEQGKGIPSQNDFLTPWHRFTSI